jgi:hypothetical protein
MYEIPSHPEVHRWVVDAEQIRSRRNAKGNLFEVAA